MANPGRSGVFRYAHSHLARLGKRGRQEAEQYSWAKVTEAVLDIYTAVLRRNTHE